MTPVIQDNPSGWGPCAVPEQFRDMPYQPFSKGDRLGKVCVCLTARVGVPTLGPLLGVLQRGREPGKHRHRKASNLQGHCEPRLMLSLGCSWGLRLA